MAKKSVLEPLHTIGMLTTALALMEDSSIFGSLQKDLVEDLKRMRVEIKKKTQARAIQNVRGVSVIQKSYPSYLRQMKPFSGNYILINLGLGGLNLGFVAQPVIDALRARMESDYSQKHKEGPSLISGPNCNELYKTPWGVFIICYDMNSGWLFGQRI